MDLVFVYNADSGVFNTLTDIAHKLMSPKTYECNLCNLTHGYFKARDEWVGFLRDLDVEIEFLHRDEYVRKYHDEVQYPAVFIKQGEDLKLWLDRDMINSMSNTEELMQLIRSQLQQLSSGASGELAL